MMTNGYWKMGCNIMPHTIVKSFLYMTFRSEEYRSKFYYSNLKTYYYK
jgi:hypothetical protein